ncbi:MAG: shikimate kinase [Bacteroidetes bacterium]|nr:shikimate kinase [Bacteroidota bacterium]
MEDKKTKLFLVGMMGSGKSYWTKFLSKKLKVGGYDLDFLIESNEERTIAEIFEEDGEEYFRKQEAKLLRWLKEKKSFVLGTGGGTPCYNDNMEWMNKNGITIFIDPPIEQLVERLLPEKSHRPLISNLTDEELFQFLTQKRNERLVYYEQATIKLEGTEISEKNFLKISKEYA